MASRFLFDTICWKRFQSAHQHVWVSSDRVSVFLLQADEGLICAAGLCQQLCVPALLDHLPISHHCGTAYSLGCSGRTGLR